MALSRVMRYAVKRLTESLQNYAAEHGWKDYRLFFRLNEDWGAIHIIVVTDSFKSEDEDAYHELYTSINEHLREKLADDPALYSAMGISLYNFDEIPSIGREFMEPEDLLMTG
jgi:hypothetical protein